MLSTGPGTQVVSPHVVEPNLGSGPLNPSEFTSGGGMLAVLNLKLGAEANRNANLLRNGPRRNFLHVHRYPGVQPATGLEIPSRKNYKGSVGRENVLALSSPIRVAVPPHQASHRF